METVICSPDCPAPYHHTLSGYRKGCRSPQAREVTRLYKKRQLTGRPEVRMVNSIGTARRLRALAATGYTFADLAVRLGMPASHKSRIADLAAGKHPRLLVRTVKSVAQLYDELWDKPGPSELNRKRAVQKGWAPPQAWDDDEIDDPKATPQGFGRKWTVADCLAGRVPGRELSAEDRHKMVKALSKDHSIMQIVARTGMSRRAVMRFRSQAA